MGGGFKRSCCDSQSCGGKGVKVLFNSSFPSFPVLSLWTWSEGVTLLEQRKTRFQRRGSGNVELLTVFNHDRMCALSFRIASLPFHFFHKSSPACGSKQIEQIVIDERHWPFFRNYNGTDNSERETPTTAECAVYRGKLNGTAKGKHGEANVSRFLLRNQAELTAQRGNLRCSWWDGTPALRRHCSASWVCLCIWLFILIVKAAFHSP